MLVTAKLAPFCAGRPEDASDPDTGRSLAIQMSPLELDPPPVLPHAKATTVAAMRTVSPLARTIWLPLVIAAGGIEICDATPPHSPPSSQLPKSGRECAGGECGHTGVAETATPIELLTRKCPEVKSAPGSEDRNQQCRYINMAALRCN